MIAIDQAQGRGTIACSHNQRGHAKVARTGRGVDERDRVSDATVEPLKGAGTSVSV